MSTDSSDPTSAPPAASPPARSRRRFPGPWCLAVVVLALVALGLLRTGKLGAGMERAEVNVATLVLACVAAGAVFVWFLFFSGYSSRCRWGVLGAAVLGLAAAVACLRIEQVSGDLVPRLVFRWQPDADQRLARPAAATADVDLQTTTPEDFPQFLGPRRDAHLTGIRLDRNWQVRPPRLLWRQAIGAGWSTFAAVNGFAVTMEQRGDEELVTCYEVATGTMRWFHAVPARHHTVLGGAGPRATPTIHEGRVYALGATGVLRCLDGATGRPVWIEDLLARIGVTAEEDLDAIAWGRSNSPLIVDDLVVVPLGGPAQGPWVSLAAFDKATGRLVWTGGDCQASYSSPVLATIAGRRQILIVNQGYVSGHDPASGAQLWKHPWPGSSRGDASVSQVVPAPNDRLLLSKGYGVGAKLLQVSRNGPDQWQVAEVWSNSRVLRTKFCNVVVLGDHVYGLSDGILECVEVAGGRRVWKAGRYAMGQILGAGDLLVVQAESGEVALVEATPAEHRELGRLAALEGKTWNNPSLYGRYLLLRNAEQAACYELP
ncbi:MAG TPA: PQQ-like beta-propeller repeat protein [Candidatus Anammoximicrobium sp.]|nr:PQQ-like beta-propeller repeat protein [Candidatus Anammoximicrobium sp.]